jgi:hypothetical protein
VAVQLPVVSVDPLNPDADGLDGETLTLKGAAPASIIWDG